MPRSLMFFALALVLVGCDLGEQSTLPTTPPSMLRGVLTLTDTLGQQTTTFRVGENFDLSYVISNSTAREITYHKGNSGPAASFKILQGDSVVATSTDGYLFLAVALTAHLIPGDSIHVAWRAPNTAARTPKLVLAPGAYRAVVSFGGFDEATVEANAPISFTVTP